MELVVCCKATKGICDKCIHYLPHSRLASCHLKCYVLKGARCITVKEENKPKGGKVKW